MSATVHPAASNRCGKWMPRKRDYCARMLGHKGDCRTVAALADSRERLTGRRRGVRRRDDPAVTAQWRRRHKFVRLGITEDQFNELLEKQGRACAICRAPFDDGRRICADHDHNCCEKQPKAGAKTCGKCIRGLLCVKCNTWLGWMEEYGATARVYLDQAGA